MKESHIDNLAPQLPPNPPDYLFIKIINRIEIERKIAIARRRFILFSIGLISSLIALVPVFKIMQSGLIESGFIQFFSLLFSDSSVVLTYWHEFVLTLLESMPVASILAFLTTIFVFLSSLKFVVQDAKVAFKHNLASN
ncbi:MAG: hypothetical protein PHV78_02915 [Patescibacteria group bacterium]|nr:hypothetical protein [Patescibacteria group bacterium]MDD5121664.1 hypothetical protein [Patescibacteria group bacterium]MDD5222279.1 hypothetical protein [Patescibacteria group bacterium]MDD5396172.1 hypothetical protein [Patescibacteria group bacterium]